MKFSFSAQESVFQEAVEEIERKIVEAQEAAVKEAADQAVKEGRANIASAGFPSRWQSGFKSVFYDNAGVNPAAVIYHRMRLAGVFETGVTISGNPLLWLPLNPSLPSPRRYGRKLVSVNIAGKPPLLFDAEDRGRGPLYFGTPAANIRKRFDLMNIIERAADRMREFYEQNIKG